ncbi:unnamed protein product [Adineta ricciae]|uniref:Peptidase M12A domain-containing protein n=1 Tax=Adineta ricciae TaxID=249248 RepID=A0A816A077_ADIRI|nr:unnamed protein product [Adineta ricciae]
MKVIIFAVWIIGIIVANVHAKPTAVVFTKDPEAKFLNLERLPDETEGHAINASRKARGLVLMGNGARWSNGIVPYQFGSGYTTQLQADVVTRMRKIENLVAINNARCIQFRPRVSTDLYYITIQNGTGCSARLGQSTGNVTLQSPGCSDDGRTFHELLHALGKSEMKERECLFHEQSRSDRGLYVKVYPENMQTGADQQYLIYENPMADMLNSSYDYSSVMHYAKYDFSSNGKPTMEPIQSNIKIGQRYNLSNGDIQLIRRYYNCSSNGPTLPPFTIPIEPAYPSMLLSTYSSELTNQNLMYNRNGSSLPNFYYEVINVTVPAAGSYIFQCYSNIDTFGYIYNQAFYPLSPAMNLINAFDDENIERWEFSFMLTFNSPDTSLLVVTTYNPNMTGSFLIAAILLSPLPPPRRQQQRQQAALLPPLPPPRRQQQRQQAALLPPLPPPRRQQQRQQAALLPPLPPPRQQQAALLPPLPPPRQQQAALLPPLPPPR